MIKKIFIPGWFDTAENRVEYEGLNIWLKKISPTRKIDAEYVIGHSFGANYALINWEKNKNTKLILVNPSIPQKGVIDFFIRWLKFIFNEGSTMSKKRARCSLHFYLGLKQGLELIFKDYEKIINTIPARDIVFIRGKEDKYFFDENVAEKIKLKGMRVIEIDRAGHNWSENFDEAINKIVQ